MHLWFCSSGRRYLAYDDQLQSCRPEILYPQLVHDTPQTEILKNVLDAHFSDYYSCIYVQWTHVFIMDLHHSDRSMNFLLVFVKLIRQTTENGEGIWAPRLPPPGHICHRRSFDSFEVRKDFHLLPFERVVLLHPLDPGRSVLSPAALHTYKHT